MRSLALVVACSLLIAPLAFAESAPKGDAGRGATRLTSAASFMPLPAVTAATPAGLAIGGVLTVEFALDVPDAKLRGRALAMKPRLMDSLRAMVADYALTRIRPGTPPNPDMIATLAQSAMDRVVGAPGVKVLIVNVMIVERR